MSKSLELAASILPHLRENVLRGPEWKRTYGYYAAAVGLPPAAHGLAIGMAMHTIGAACVLAKVPIAPVHYVERVDGEWQGIFESEYLELTYVLPHWNTIAVSARVHPYTESNFSLVEKALSTVIPKYLNHLATPKKLWRFLIQNEVEPGVTWLQRAMPAYEEAVQHERQCRNAR